MASEAVLGVVVEEMRAANDVAMTVGDALDQKANFLFAGMSLIFGLVAAVVGSRESGELRLLAYWVLAIPFVVLYVAGTLVFLFVVLPRNYRLALLADRETIRREMIDRNAEDAMLALISGYVETIAHNRSLNKTKSRGVRACTGILVGMLAVCMALGFLAM
jgi:hypothetical protein